ncbi:MAG: hypothetical protein B6244_14490 [Candidatus Cloacimonetes bacterium 4572_55]|nr:MAG: hypothetical protein B6244_14490 [Candidatus Cloacimonetes bacterium 4572_55]
MGVNFTIVFEDASLSSTTAEIKSMLKYLVNDPDPDSDDDFFLPTISISTDGAVDALETFFYDMLKKISTDATTTESDYSGNK